MKQPFFPSFFYDSSSTDKCEEVIDYFLSWTLRCAQQQYKNSPYKMVHQYAKHILSELLFNQPDELNNKEVSSVKAWKQSHKIDLWVEVEIVGETIGEKDKHALVIENKLYSRLMPHQLGAYKAIAEEYYHNKEKYEMHYIFLRCDDKEQDLDIRLCKENEYRHVLLSELVDAMGSNAEITGHELFDEFWFYWWNPENHRNT